MLLSKIIKILPNGYQKSLSALLALGVLMAGIEIVSISLLFSLVSYVNNGDGSSATLLTFLGLNNVQIDAIFLFFLLSYFLASLLKMLINYFNLWVSNCISRDLSISLSKSIFLTSYQELLTLKNPEELIASLNMKVANVATKGVFQYLSFYSSLIVVIFIITFSSLMLSSVAIISIAILVIFYIFLSSISAKFFRTLSVRVNNNIDKSQQSVFIFFSSLKEVYITNRGSALADGYAASQVALAEDRTNATFVGTSSRSFLEVFLFGCMLLYFAFAGSGFKEFVAIVVTSLIVLQRIAPYAQAIYASHSVLNANKSEILSAVKLIEKYGNQSMPVSPLCFNLKNPHQPKDIIFSCDGASINRGKSTLKIPDLSIATNEKVGCMGPSGAGKSSIADLIFGLLESSNGGVYRSQVLYAAKPIRVSYVSQSPCFFSGTLLSNLTSHSQDINIPRLYSLLEQACCLEFVKNRLNDDVGPLVSSFSGGQIKRLALVRALYSLPKLLILDEFMSGISDHHKVALKNLIYDQNDLAVFHISHVLKDLERSDRVIYI